MIDEELGLHLSQNENKHVYRESPEEGLVQKFKIIKAQAAPNNTWKAVEIIGNAAGVAAKQQELLGQDYVWSLMETFQPAGLHYLNRKDDMKLSKFHDTMFSSYGGVRHNV
jgi:hypothetical protein